MSGEESEQDKSELPSQHKLRKAREQGQVARGMDLGFFATLAAGLLVFWLSGERFVEAMARAMREAFVGTSSPDRGAILHTISGTAVDVMGPVLTLAASVFGVALLLELIQTGVVFSAKPLKPDFSKLNPAKGLKRIFSMRMLIETAKNVVKLAVYATVAWMVIDQVRMHVLAMPDAFHLAAELHHTGLRLLAWFTLIALLFVVFDQLIVRRDFTKKMRMSRREVRREHREREGEPRLKQRRKQLHAEFVKLSQSLRGIRGADMLVVNPIHYAVALRYDRNRDTAPLIVARGSNAIALRLRRLAFLHGVIIIEDPVLARALFRRGALDRMIPEDLYRPVAAHYRALPATQH
ncbi:EscU/YscU/HrcU family type III secretion system export apparatus switch protein [Sphingomonas sanxanigenens]|uniref:Flagellar biosynthesis protein FlhB n=1 Tax=Sphingomonas sanxanigenens DSM 19645 = NX02 TaxID=1123269 RepID=W0AGJ2_9SPHN|nr:EscU/YscU/HrcU family type III secretion system export apparatus switch protein [Sphingomonas sanxanigenens]AHE55662.1 hypothetical protein NX02_20015 [Sphingomonas sanxanigenens DSM 19645 = NX02]